MSLSTGMRLGSYEIVAAIGSGGMGEVYRARDARLKRDVAIKILTADTDTDEAAKRRLLREARAAAALSHPSIVAVYAVEEAERLLFIVMELVDGTTLADRLATGPLDFAEICDVGAQVADALSAAHAAGIIHHDITPRNILLTADGRAKLADFGLSRPIESERMAIESTRSGPPLGGTLHYMSPEQIQGAGCTARTDLFSFGSVMYHAATGRRPFEGRSPFAVMNAICSAEPPLPSVVRPDLPAGFDPLLRRMLAKSVEDRTVDAADVARILRTLKGSVAGQRSAPETTVHEANREKPPFVGRERERAAVLAALSGAVAGEGTTILVTGDAGLGKSALLDAFLHAPQTIATDALVCRGQCVEHSGAGEPYLPVIDALAPHVAHPGQGLHDIIGTFAPSWQFQFPVAYGHSENPAAPPTPARLARELGDALCAAARSRPIILILEDLHWADPSTIELLRHLAHRIGRAAILTIVTCRAEEAAARDSSLGQALVDLEARGTCEHIALNPLKEENVREYLERRYGLPDVARALAALVFSATEGHPLFIVSLVHLFMQRGDLRQIDREWQLATPIGRLHLTIPRTVQAVIRRKLSGLRESDLRLFEHASVEGQEFSTSVLTALTRIDPAALEERLDALAKSLHIIAPVGPERYPDGTWGARYRFVHALYQNVVYDDLPVSRRASLHRLVAERLAALYLARTTPIASQLARHFKEGRDWGRAFEYFVQAGDHSMTVSAAREAEAHYADAVALATIDATAVEPGRLAVALQKRGNTRGFLGDAEPALTDLRNAFETASAAGERDLMFGIQLDTIYANALAGRLTTAIRVAADLETSAEPPPGGVKRLRYLLAHLQMQIAAGNLDTAAVEADNAVALARALDESVRLSFGLTVRAQVRYFRADYSSALEDLRESGSAATALTRLADPRPGNIFFHRTAYLGRLLGDCGHISEALATLNAGLEIARSDGYSFWVPRYVNAIGTIYIDIGAFDAALQHDGTAAAEVVDQTNEVPIESRLNRISACLRLRRFDCAASCVSEAASLIGATAWYQWFWRIRFATAAAEHALALGDFAGAIELAHECSTQARRHQLWKHALLAERLLADTAAKAGDWVRARTHVRQASEICAAHPVPIVTWRIHATAMQVYSHVGEHERAATERRSAQEQVGTLAASMHDATLRTTFLESEDVRNALSGASLDLITPD
jgi:tetratricopeptide (TPR) repeat protein